MCGFFAIAQKSPEHARLADIARVGSDALRHRGPDGAGVWTTGDGLLALSHRRLAVIDVSSAGAQPMSSKSGRFTITFNGEIYNFGELRALLEIEGSFFKGHSDTEVLLEAFERWGVSRAISNSRGMFGFALFDAHERKLFIYRDRLGEKPVYYYTTERLFAVASESRAFRHLPDFDGSLDPGAVALFLRFGYVPSPHSIYRKVRKLEPGRYLVLDLNSASRTYFHLSENDYWRPAEHFLAASQKQVVRTEEDILEELDARLGNCVRERLVADVPIGAFLSGGIDSSCVVAFAQKATSMPLHTFTVGFSDPAFDERAFGRSISQELGTHHTELTMDSGSLLGLAPQIPRIFDEPFADSSAIPTVAIARLARSFVTVAVTGDGGDELMAGYTRHLMAPRLFSALRRTPTPLRALARSAMGPLSSDVASRIYATIFRDGARAQLPRKLRKLRDALHSRSLDDFYRRLLSHWQVAPLIALDARELPTWIDNVPRNEKMSDLDRLLLLDVAGYLPEDVLQKVDRASMSVALETRAPYLDHELMEFAWGLPAEVKIRDGKGKWALRRVLSRYVSSASVERPKMGFSVPMASWLRGPLHEWAEALISATQHNPMLNSTIIREVWNSHISGRSNNENQIWTLLMLQSWLESTAPVADAIGQPFCEPSITASC